MKRDVFERYVRDKIMRGYSANAILKEIDEMIARFGYLVLENDEGEEIVFEKFWLNNFKYRDYITSRAGE